MNHPRYLQRALFVAVCLFYSVLAPAQSAWVSDSFEITLRTGPSTNNEIRLMLDSGARLEILEVDEESGYTQVRTSGGTEGWVLSRYLMDEVSAREQLAGLASELTNGESDGATVSTQAEAIEAVVATGRQRIADLEREKTEMQSEIAEIRRVSANALAIDNQNQDLQRSLTDAEIRIGLLEQENSNLGSETTRNWFITGALVLFGGILVGLILPRIKFQRKSRYDRF